MISVLQYRAAIGCHAAIAQKAQHMHKLGQALHARELYDSYEHMLHVYAKLMRNMIISFVGLYDYVVYASLRIRLILLANDIETNPGPLFSSLKQGSFNQGHPKYGEAAGNQCAAIALYALCFSQNVSPSLWTTLLIDNILDKGTELYYSLKKPRFLEVTDLPSLVYTNWTLCHTTFSYCHQGVLTQEYESIDSFNLFLTEAFSQTRNVLVWVGNITLALMIAINGTVFLFDSHSMDMQGRITDNGASSLLQFSTINNVGYYISSVFMCNSTKIPYEFQMVTISPLHPLPSAENNNGHFDLPSSSFSDNLKVLHDVCAVSLSECSKKIPLKRTSRQKTNFINKKTCIEVTNLYLHKSTYPIAVPIFNIAELKQLTLSAIFTSLFKPVSKWTANTVERIIQHRPPMPDVGTSIVNLQSGVIHYAGVELNFSYQSHKFTSKAFISEIGNHWSTCCAAVISVSESFILGLLKESHGNKVAIFQLSLDGLCRKQIPEKPQEVDLLVFKFFTLLSKYVECTYICQNMSSIQAELITLHNPLTDSQIKKFRRNFNYVTNMINTSIEKCIENFQSAVEEGPFYICVVCHRLLYKRSVLLLNAEKYNDKNILTEKPSFDGKKYICKTCHQKLLKNKIPCQAVSNKLEVFDIPEELNSLNKLESILVAQQISFQKIIVMQKGQQRKIRGAVCNVPIDYDTVCKHLPRPPSSSGFVMIKLKRKIEFNGHCYFQAVRPEFVTRALTKLREINFLYQSIEINASEPVVNGNALYPGEETERIDEHDNGRQHAQFEDDINQCTENEENEEQEDPLNKYKSMTSETCLQSKVPQYPLESDDPQLNTITSIAPGQNRHPVSLMTEQFSEELCFPTLFPYGKFGFNASRNIPLTVTKYCNSRLLNYSGRFASNPEYLFFMQFVVEQKKVSDNIAVALRKMRGNDVTAGRLRGGSNDLQRLIFSDQAFLFLQKIPGSPSYWKKFQNEVLAMVKQLGMPTWFMTLSCADLRWKELLTIICKCHHINLSPDQLADLSYEEKCKLLNLNPVITARHYQYRVETFFKEILLSKLQPLGKIVYYAIRIEFQNRGAPHVHSLLWTESPPQLTNSTTDNYIDFIDNHIKAYLPNKLDDEELYDLVETYQKHSHSKTCRKYKNGICRFHFGRFFSERTIIARPLPDDIDETLHTTLLKQRETILVKVKEYIDQYLNPKNNEHWNRDCSIVDILEDLGIDTQEYHNMLSISPDREFRLILKRTPNSCFINNYFTAGLKAFKANIDIQPVFSYFQCVAYMCAYFSKTEDGCSESLRKATKEVVNQSLDTKNALRKIGATFLSSREVSAQECVFRCLPELWLRKVFPGAIFVNTDVPENRVRMMKSSKDLELLDETSTEIFQRNLIDRYSERPYQPSCVNNLCLAQFAAYYYKSIKYNSDNGDSTNDDQPEVLTDTLMEQQSPDENQLPKVLHLLHTNEMMKKRKIRAVVRFHKFNEIKEPEKLAHHLLMLYFPWRNESHLVGEHGTYTSKLNESNTQRIVERNKQFLEPHADEIDMAQDRLSQHPVAQIFHILNSSIEETEECSGTNDLASDPQDASHIGQQTTQSRSGLPLVTSADPSAIDNDKLHAMVRTLNQQQRLAFDTVLTWCRNTAKCPNTHQQNRSPLQLFITGGAGAGKSHLITTLYHTVVKTFRQISQNPEKPSVLLLAPTGIAAINISGTTVNSGLSIPIDNFGYSVTPLSDMQKSALRNHFSELKMIIIDEISMVSNMKLLFIHQRLKEIFCTPEHKLFAGKAVIAVGDLFQLPPCKERSVFFDYKQELLNLCHPWKQFTMIELTEIMRQKDDKEFVQLLNRLRTGNCLDNDLEILKSRIISTDDPSYPTEALHVFAENSLVNDHNNKMLEKLDSPSVTLVAFDKYPQNVSSSVIQKTLSRSHCQTGGLHKELTIKEGARVMVTTNIDIEDRLINGQLGTVKQIRFIENATNPAKIYVKFDDPQAGLIALHKSGDQFAKDNGVVPIERVLTRIKISERSCTSPVIERNQFPLTLSWASTIHKVQGLTVEKLVVSFQLNKQKSFGYGQIYVALSRVTSLSSLYIVGDLDPKHIKADPRVVQEYQRLQSARKTALVEDMLPGDETSCVISLLNIRSLKKHFIDLCHDESLMTSNIIALTETHVYPNQNTSQIVLPSFKMKVHNNCNPYNSMALFYCSSVELASCVYLNEINGLLVTAIKSNAQINILLLYRNNNTLVQNFLLNLREILSSHTIHIILGDFNINFFNPGQSSGLVQLMDSFNFCQTVSDATFVPAGTLLDQIYVNTAYIPPSHTHTLVKSVYYSDHDAVKINYPLMFI